MNRFLLSGMMCLMIATALEAAPRGRRARRRAARQTTTQSYARSSQNSTGYNTNYRYNNYSRPASSTVPATITPTVQPVTAYKPVINEPVQPASEVAETTLAMTDLVPEIASEVAPIGVVQPAVGEVVQASAIQPVPDVMPNLKSGGALTAQQPFCASCSVIPAGQSFGSALAELNGIRASRGLPGLIEDPSLSAIAHQKASVQANAGTMYHPGGSMGGARFEGVGMGPRFTTCYQDATNVTYAGAATVVGRNGQRYHCLLVK